MLPPVAAASLTLGFGLLVLGAAPARGQSTAATASDPAAPAGRAVSGFDFGGTGETIFEHTRASLRDPHFGMRVYLAHKVPGTLSVVSDPGSADADARAALPDGNHKFWDVAFGERAPVLGWYDVHPTRSVRHARGIQLNIDAAAFLLLDFTAQSSAVINTDYRLGASVDARPWSDGWDLLSFSVGFFHQSTHLGDEYTLSAGTIQDSAPPTANPALPYRANPSYLAFPATVSFDLSPEGARWLTGRIYFGGTVFAYSGLPQATHPEFRAGLEFRLGAPEETWPQGPTLAAAPTTADAAPRIGDAAPTTAAAEPAGSATAPAALDDQRGGGGFFSAVGAAATRFGHAASRFGLGHPTGNDVAAQTSPPPGQAEPSARNERAPAPEPTGASPPATANVAAAAAASAAPPASPHQARRLRRGIFSYVLSYEALSQRQYLHDPDPVRRGQPVFLMGDGRWLTHHLMAMVVLNLDTERSTSNALAGAVEYLDGRNQHGQLMEYDSLRTIAFSFSYYW